MATIPFIFMASQITKFCRDTTGAQSLHYLLFGDDYDLPYLNFTMAESTENAIPNQKNSQKHVVIFPIDVHHRHDSQVSQILDPDKASDITKAQQKNLESKKTPAKRI
ncbi:hypothetical protein TNCT_344981 [Trichonephila clavata]|uniref:Uncharacterized protein n=1 Tax=Trichonephila clavata TaxID=2740835 RepID=A0A8X6F794_TRICU|nr:hypothetical protein TNCT_344981 [Trichonephila clavata]